MVPDRNGGGITRRLTRTAVAVMTIMAVPKKEKILSLRSRKNARAINTVTTAPTLNGSVKSASPVTISPCP